MVGATLGRTLQVVAHTDAEYLGRIEDHLEGRGIRFTYLRPHHSGGWLPPSSRSVEALCLLGGGPWSTTGDTMLPSLERELRLTRDCLERHRPVIGIGLGAQILALAAGGAIESAPLIFETGEALRVDAEGLGGLLPERYPIAIYMRDRPLPPAQARLLARDRRGHPALFQIGDNAFGFSAHPGAKAAMFEDLVMEFDEAPQEVATTLGRLGELQSTIEDTLVPIMAGLVRATGLMSRG